MTRKMKVQSENWERTNGRDIVELMKLYGSKPEVSESNPKSAEFRDINANGIWWCSKTCENGISLERNPVLNGKCKGPGEKNTIQTTY